MFLLALMSVVSLGGILVTVRWALQAPHGPLDGAARVLAATIAGGVLAFWIVAASMAPEVNENAKNRATALEAPTVEDARAIATEIIASAPVGMDIAAGSAPVSASSSPSPPSAPIAVWPEAGSSPQSHEGHEEKNPSCPSWLCDWTT